MDFFQFMNINKVSEQKVADTPKANIICHTKLNNIIVRNDNLGKFGYMQHHALSHVSSGERESNNVMKLGDGRLIKTRVSNDLFKYKLAMEYVPEGHIVWSDGVSLMSERYVTEWDMMYSIGMSYKISENTIVTLEEEDAKKLKNINVDIKRMCDTIASLRILDKTDTINFELQMSNFVTYMQLSREDIATAFENKSPYSYWTRAWTMQERHQSNKMVYGENVNDKFNKILDTGKLLEQLQNISSNWKSLVVTLARYKPEESLNEYMIQMLHRIRLYASLMAGSQRAVLRDNGEISSLDQDVILVQDIADVIKTARNRNEMFKAITIAFNIMPEKPGEKEELNILAKEVYKKIVSKGYFPAKFYYGGKQEKMTWWPDEVTHYEKDANGSFSIASNDRYYSSEFRQFIKCVENVSAIINPAGSAVLKGINVNTELINVKTTNGGYNHDGHKGEENIISNVFVKSDNDKRCINCDANITWYENNIKGEEIERKHSCSVDVVLTTSGINNICMTAVVIGRCGLFLSKNKKNVVGSMHFSYNDSIIICKATTEHGLSHSNEYVVLN
jgi:hypothetical protein